MGRMNILVYPCPICEDDLEIRIDKNEKPYCICDRCGVQLFIRKAYGIRKLAEQLEMELNEESPYENKDKNMIANFAKLVILIQKNNQLNKKLDEIDEQDNFLFPDEELEKQRTEIKKDLKSVKKEIEKITEI